jgi:hypothetical protein
MCALLAAGEIINHFGPVDFVTIKMEALSCRNILNCC